MTWVRKSVDSVDEQMLAMGCIVSDVFLSKMIDLFDPEFFINSSLKTICNWCITYYKEFEQAPKNHIQDIFEERRLESTKPNRS